MPDPRYHKKQGILARLFDAVITRTFRFINRKRPWHKIGKWPGVFNLLALRIELREHNLHDMDGDLTVPKSGCPFHNGPALAKKRTENGTHNDLSFPAMGCTYSRLGRNMHLRRPEDTDPGLLVPDPFVISQRILQRDTFKPATGLNLIAGAWIQFQVHDWFGHENETLSVDDADPKNEENAIRLPQAGDWQHGDMVIPKTIRDKDADPAYPHPVYRNKNPQWWDGSQVYGDDFGETMRLRTDPKTKEVCKLGKLYVDETTDLLPENGATGIALSGFTDNWWMGLEILHTLFALEHNAICDAIHAAEPQLTDQELFEISRLVNCAVMAKIHTVQWTPGIIGHPSLPPAMDLNWMGLVGRMFSEKTARKIAPWIPNTFLKEMLTGIPDTAPDHHGVPFSLTEEFNAVYRLHPLIPDEVKIMRFGTNEDLGTFPMEAIAFKETRDIFKPAVGATMLDAIFSFGKAHPGAIMARNFPNFLRNLKLPLDPKTGREQRMDLAAVDIIRDRERGVPRYCEFRRQLRMEPPKTFEELAGLFDGRRKDLPNLVEVLREVYNNDLETVDNMVGMFLEEPPEKFGFSDTAFRIFILMASRRLKSDRFFTEHYTEEYYTRTGLDWVSTTGFREVVVRHYPALDKVIPKDTNPFGPW